MRWGALYRRMLSDVYVEWVLRIRSSDSMNGWLFVLTSPAYVTTLKTYVMIGVIPCLYLMSRSDVEMITDMSVHICRCMNASDIYVWTIHLVLKLSFMLQNWKSLWKLMLYRMLLLLYPYMWIAYMLFIHREVLVIRSSQISVYTSRELWHNTSAITSEKICLWYLLSVLWHVIAFLTLLISQTYCASSDTRRVLLAHTSYSSHHSILLCKSCPWEGLFYTTLYQCEG